MADPRFDSNFTIYPVWRHSSSLSIIRLLLLLIAQQNAKMEGFKAEIDKIKKNFQGLENYVCDLENDRRRLKDENQDLRQRSDWESCDNLSVEDVWNSREFWQ